MEIKGNADMSTLSNFYDGMLSLEEATFSRVDPPAYYWQLKGMRMCPLAWRYDFLVYYPSQKRNIFFCDLFLEFIKGYG